MKFITPALAGIIMGIASVSAAGDTAQKLSLTILRDTGGTLPNAIFSGASETEINALTPAGSSPVECRVFHVANADGKACLIDTGRGGPTLREDMAKAGISPESVGAILLTHTHGDHTGGLLADDNASPAFTNATVHITASELDFWRKSRPANAAACEKVYKFDIIAPDGESHVFMPRITVVAAPGHTPGHVAFLLDTPDRPTLVAGDLLHSEMQLKNKNICASFDSDKPAAAESRKKLLARAAAEGWSFTSTHLPETFYRFDGE